MAEMNLENAIEQLNKVRLILYGFSCLDCTQIFCKNCPYNTDYNECLRVIINDKLVALMRESEKGSKPF